MKKVYAFLAVFLMAAAVAGQVKYDSHTIDPPYVEAGDDVDLTVKFHEGLTKREIYSTQRDNQGAKVPLKSDSKVYYISQISPKNTATGKYILIKQDKRDIGNVFPGETWSSSFGFHIKDDAPATNYTLVFEVLKTDMDGVQTPEVVISKDITVKVSGEPKFTFISDSELSAGEKSQFTVTVANIGGGIASQSIVSLNTTYPITVLKSASTSIGDMKSSDTKTISYEVYVDSRAEPKAYTIPLKLTYTDKSGTTQTVQEKLGVRVMTSPVVSANLDSIGELTGGKEATATVSVVNKGFVDAKFLSIDVL
ncbi:MAG: hypothetical protein KKD39_04400, partial [Candidatus Altiarchaeota archaeon]|nr:hypothetical protein [Candidatus Altiarchaeota archaeon]